METLKGFDHQQFQHLTQEDCELVQFQFLLVPEDPASLRQESHLIPLNFQNKMILIITNPASFTLHISKG